MLVTISDLHLTDGSVGTSAASGAFQVFADRLQELAIAASWRADGSYRPIERLDLLLLGDVLDVIRSRRWTEQDRIRPWDDPRSPALIDLVTHITSDILRYNYEAVESLRSLAQPGTIRVPPTASGPAAANHSEWLPVSVQIHYMVGNHDWFFHLKGSGYNVLREALVRQIGLANRWDEPFPHEPQEDDELLAILRRHRVLARHGDVFDPLNFEGDRDASSLGDCIVVELLNRFATRADVELGERLPAAAIAGLREIDNVRPLLLVPVWLETLLERTCPLAAQRQAVKRLWDELVQRFLDLPFVRAHDTWRPGELVDGLQRLLRFSRRLSIDRASELADFLARWQGLSGEAHSYARHALAEADFRNRRARHIVYGHTHRAETIPLEVSYADGYVLNQLYFNTGTWRRTHRPTQLANDRQEFVPSDVMTYAAFYCDDERGGRPYEMWSGTLAPAPQRATLYRVDAPPAAVADRASARYSRRIPGHGPHFATTTLVTPEQPVERFED